MHDLPRLARFLRCDPSYPGQAFRHRLVVAIAIAALILILSLLGDFHADD
ncbi:hypothetical protein [Paenirhodobacter populi]|nr:hypothetical protein [Sinirhodobacter populi]